MNAERALEELFRASPAEFTRKREELSKRLREEGDEEGARAVHARRKPTQLAWVLNQLSRRQPEELAKLVDVGRELAREQRRALRGAASSEFREALARQRRVIVELMRRTAELMRELGLDPKGHTDEIAAALQAALVDPAIGARLEEGRLTTAPRAVSGFGQPSLQVVSDARVRAAPRPSKRRERAHAKQATIEAEKKQRAERAALERERKRAVASARAALRAARAAAHLKTREAARADVEAKKHRERAEKLAHDASASRDVVEKAEADLERALAQPA